MKEVITNLSTDEEVVFVERGEELNWLPTLNLDRLLDRGSVFIYNVLQNHRLQRFLLTGLKLKVKIII